MRSIGALVIASSLLACSSTPTAPTPVVPVRLIAEISQTVIARGEGAAITFRLENTSSNDLELTFPASCQILPYISRREAVVYPPGGGFACATVITKLSLPVGASVTHSVLVRASDAVTYPYIALAPGEYVTYARLGDYLYQVSSPQIAFTVQ